MKKLIVNEDACIGCGACVSIDPEHFDFDDNGLSSAISNESLDSESLTNAIESCPTGAIKIEGCACGDNCTCGEDCNCTEDNKCNPDCQCHKGE